VLANIITQHTGLRQNPGLIDEFDVGAAGVGARIFSGAKCRGAAGEHLRDILNDCFTNVTDVFVEERQPFLLSI